jgi:Leucine-rich repeat (LRR) protein
MSNPSGYIFINDDDDDDDSSNIHFINTTATIPSTGSVTAGTSTTTTTGTSSNTTGSVNHIVSSSSSIPPTTTTTAAAAQHQVKPFPVTQDSIPLPMFTLPDGRLIDGKNTLQSFDTGGNGVVPMTTSPLADKESDGGGTSTKNNSTPPFTSPPPMLPDGRMIDGKNTLQSFAATIPTIPMKSPDTNAATNPVSRTLTTTTTTANVVAIALTEEEPPSPHSMTSTPTFPSTGQDHVVLRNHGERTVLHAEAVAVVDAEISESQIAHWTLPPTIKPQRLHCWAFIIILSFIVIGVATYCGTGNCGNSSSALQPNLSPTTFYDQSLSIACNFLNSANLSECQSITLFSRNSMGDTIPSEIGLLTQMTALELDTIALTGSIPSTLGGLTNLKNLLLNENLLTGIIPSSLGNLTELVELRLNQNQLTSTIPSALGDLQQLTLLRLHTNQLYGTIPFILGNLTKLTSLSLRDNFLNGTVPSSLGDLTLLTGLWLFNNTNLTGTIPSALCSVSKLNIRIDCANIVCSCCFDYSGNTTCPVTAPTVSPPTNTVTRRTVSPIKVPIPTTSSPSEASTTVFTSLLPSKLPTRVMFEEELAVACNFLNMSGLSECQAMTTFDGRSTGKTIPSELGLLTQLTHLSLIDNQLSGTIPSTLGNLVQLTVLYLSINQLTGTIPSTLGSLINLTDLSLLGNQLTGTVPSTLGNLAQLTYLDVGSNQLNGTIPSSLCSVSGIVIYIDCANIMCMCCRDSNSGSCL